MFGIGGTELVIIAVVLLIAVGPSRLPKLLKAGVSAYREFRRATRELRASTGIDEILQDEDLRDLRKPLDLSLSKKPRPKKSALGYSERVQENPPEGVDLAEIRELEERPDAAEREKIRAAKDAQAADQEVIRQAKITAAEAQTDEGRDAIRQAKIAAAETQTDEERDAIRQAKIAAATPEYDPVVAAKVAAREEEEREADASADED